MPRSRVELLTRGFSVRGLENPLLPLLDQFIALGHAAEQLKLALTEGIRLVDDASKAQIEQRSCYHGRRMGPDAAAPIPRVIRDNRM